MIALDTNVLVRFLVDDEPKQADIASDLVNQPAGVFVSKTTLLELEWVLRQVYKIETKVVGAGLLSLFGMANVTVECADQVAQAMDDFAAGMDFADALHLASAPEGEKLHTFDQKFAKLGRRRGVALAGGRNPVGL